MTASKNLYQRLDEAICEYLRGGVQHPIHVEHLRRVACSVIGVEYVATDDRHWRLIDRRLQAMRKGKRLVYERTKGSGHGRWQVLNVAKPALTAVARPEPAVTPSAGDPVMVYAARFNDMPGYGAITVDAPERAKTVASEIATWVRRGAAVERVSLEAGRAGMGEYIKARREQETNAEADAETQGDLFGGMRCAG